MPASIMVLAYILEDQMVTVAITVGIVVLPCFFAGVFTGRMLERQDWNQLILDGKIPRPQKKRLTA